MQKEGEDRGFLYVDPQYLRDIQQFIKLGKFKISNDRFKYSTNNIVLPFSFNIEDLFLENATANIKISKEKLQHAIEQIKLNKEFGSLRRGDRSFYYMKYHEFMNLEDFLEFYSKYLEKRMEESEKQRYKIRFANEIEMIKQLKTAKYIETETLKLGGSLTQTQQDKLDQKIVQFQGGLNYAIEKLNYHQAQGMLRKLCTVPQPPMKMALGKRTRLFSFKTGQNLIKALDEITHEPGMLKKHPELVEFRDELEERKALYSHMHGKQLSEIMKKEVQQQISDSVALIDNTLKNGPRPKPGKTPLKLFKLKSTSVSRANLASDSSKVPLRPSTRNIASATTLASLRPQTASSSGKLQTKFVGAKDSAKSLDARQAGRLGEQRSVAGR